MYIIKNALRNISRNMGRSLLIGLITLVIAVSGCLALSITQASANAKETELQSKSVTATIAPDYEKIQASLDTSDMRSMQQAIEKYRTLSLSDMQKYAESEYADNFIYTMELALGKTETFVPYEAESSEDDSEEQDNNQPSAVGPGGGMMVTIGSMGLGDFSLTGFSDESAMTDFLNGTNQITSGELFGFGEANNTCLISETLASVNDLKPGDEIKMVNSNREEEVYTLIISGIYSIKASESSFSAPVASLDPINKIYTNYETLKAVSDNSEANAEVSTNDRGMETTTAIRSTTNGTYVFSNTENLNSFREDVKRLGLDENYSVTSADEKAYEQSLVPLNSLSKFAGVFFWIVLGIGAVILIAINLFNIRERKYEVGVLTAIGMKKRKVAVQFVAEIFVVTFAAVMIGTAAGAVAALPVTNSLLQSFVSSQEEDLNSQDQAFNREPGARLNVQGGPSGNRIGGGFRIGAIAEANTPVEYLSNVSSATDLNVVAELVLIGLGLTLITSLGAVAFIMRYEPLKILANRT